MKKCLTLLLLILSVCAVQAQVNFISAGSTSGVVNTNTNGLNIGYSFAASTASFTYGTAKEVSVPGGLINGVQQPNSAKYIASNFTLTSTVSNGSSSIFSGGQFVPGFTLAYEYVWNSNEFKKSTAYWFIRPNFGMQQNNFVSKDATDTLRVTKKFNVTVGFTPGVNLIFSTNGHDEDEILAFSLPIAYNLNPVDELMATNYSTDYIGAANGFTGTTNAGYKTTQANYFSITPKVDYVWSPWVITNKVTKAEISRIGFIATVSGLYNTNEKRMVGNFGIGPSIHPANSTSSIISALQAEFTDFTNSTGKKGFKDIFAVNFYVGIPLALK